jgi:hypothetical protein
MNHYRQLKGNYDWYGTREFLSTPGSNKISMVNRDDAVALAPKVEVDSR